MKKVVLFLLLSSIFYGAQSQRVSKSRKVATNKSNVGVGIEAGLPIGQNGKPYSAVIGGSIQYETMPDSDIGLTLSGGYQHWIRNSTYGGISIGFVPLLAGVKYYFTPGAFFHAQLGAAVGTRSGQGTSFAYSPGIGIKLSPNVDATLKYTGLSRSGGTLDNVSLRVGFTL